MAVTRAREPVHVVGDREPWTETQSFATLAARLEVVDSGRSSDVPGAGRPGPAPAGGHGQFAFRRLRLGATRWGSRSCCGK